MERANAIAEIVANKTGLEAKAQEVRKGDAVYLAIAVNKGSISPVIYIEHYFDDGMTDDEIVDKVIEVANMATPNFKVDDFADWELAKDNLVVCLRAKTSNEVEIKKDYLDMEMFVKFKLNDGSGSVTIKKEHAAHWGVDEDLVFKVAKANTVGKFRADSLLKILMGAGYPLDDYEINITENDMICLTNGEKLFGASAILDNIFLGKIADKLDDDIYILPSSIHEVIAIPARNAGTIEEMSAMITEINMAMVAPEERLSNHPYFFERNVGKLTIC